jgi:hypothetical protein
MWIELHDGFLQSRFQTKVLISPGKPCRLSRKLGCLRLTTILKESNCSWLNCWILIYLMGRLLVFEILYFLYSFCLSQNFWKCIHLDYYKLKKKDDKKELGYKENKFDLFWSDKIELLFDANPTILEVKFANSLCLKVFNFSNIFYVISRHRKLSKQ